LLCSDVTKNKFDNCSYIVRRMAQICAFEGHGAQLNALHKLQQRTLPCKAS